MHIYTVKLATEQLLNIKADSEVQAMRKTMRIWENKREYGITTASDSKVTVKLESDAISKYETNIDLDLKVHKTKSVAGSREV